MSNETQELVRRIGVIGDVHGADLTLGAALSCLSFVPRLSALFCTGDLPAKHDHDRAAVARCCHLLKEANVVTVRGNHDRWYLENLANADDKRYDFATNAFIASLPPIREFDTPRGPLILCHGLGDDDMAGIYPGDTDEQATTNLWRHELSPERVRFVVNGHTHKPSMRTLDDITVINAGTLHLDDNMDLWDHDPCFCVVDFEAGFVQFYELTPWSDIITSGERFDLP